MTTDCLTRLGFLLCLILASACSKSKESTPRAAETTEPHAAPPATSDAATADPGDPPSASDGPDALALELAAYEAARPAFDQHCADCHTSTEKPSKKRKEALDHFVMDDYPFRGHHADELGATIREVLGVDAEKATMPADDPGSVQGEDLERIVAWSRAYDDARAEGVGHHGKAKDPDGDHAEDGDHGHGDGDHHH